VTPRRPQVVRMEPHSRRPGTRFRLLRVLALVPLLTSCAGSASVSGMLVPRGPARLDQAVVYVQPEDPASAPQLAEWDARASITFSHQSLKPSISVATVGSWLEVWNADSVYHQPFSRSPALPFAARTVKPGTGYAVRLTSGGVIEVFCQLHAGESAELLVLENAAWTRPDSAGAFRLPPLPKGRYVLHAWHPRLGEQSAPLDIEKAGHMSVELRY
jgi:hypothetical protein